MPTPVKLQLALQGGGARLYALVAALESLAEFEARSELLVGRIAGTSAGAIAGGLYAAGVSPAVLRTYLGRADIKPIMSPPFWPFDTKQAWLSRVVRGQPAGSEKAATKLLEGVMKENGVPTDISLEQVAKRTGKRLAIVATDAKGRQPKPFTTETHGSERLIDVMMHSAALPFFFRNVPNSEQPLILDGGLCMNLPTDCLIPHTAEDGPVVAVTFREGMAEQPRSVIALGALLLDIAMHASVLRSRSAPNVTILELDSGDVSTLDFTVAQRACREVSSEYTLAKDQTRRFFETYRKAKAGQVLGSDFWNAPVSIMDTVYNLYKARDATQAFKYFRRSFHVTVEKPDNSQAPTLIRQELEFSPGPVPIAMIAPQVSVGSPADIEAVWVYIEEQGTSRQVPFTLLPFRTPMETGGSGHVYGLLIALVPMLQGDGKFTLTIEYWGKGILSELADKMKKSEDLTSRAARAAGTIDEWELGVFAPSGTLVSVTPVAGTGFAALQTATKRPSGVPLQYEAHVFQARNVQPTDKVSIRVVRA